MAIYPLPLQISAESQFPTFLKNENEKKLVRSQSHQEMVGRQAQKVQSTLNFIIHYKDHHRIFSNIVMFLCNSLQALAVTIKPTALMNQKQ